MIYAMEVEVEVVRCSGMLDWSGSPGRLCQSGVDGCLVWLI